MLLRKNYFQGFGKRNDEVEGYRQYLNMIRHDNGVIEINVEFICGGDNDVLKHYDGNNENQREEADKYYDHLLHTGEVLS